MCLVETKICSKCKEEKPLSGYGLSHSKKSKPGALRSTCKECDRNRTREYRSKDEVKSIYAERLKEYRIKNQENIKEYQTIRKYRSQIGSKTDVFCSTCICCGIAFIKKEMPRKKMLYDYKNKCKACFDQIDKKDKKLRLVPCFLCNKIHLAKTWGKMCKECLEQRKKEYWEKYYKVHGRNKQMRRIAILNKAEKETIRILDVYERDNWTCYICGVKVIKSSNYRKDMATIDHVIPLSKGGSHTYENVKTCCHSCNSKKRDKIYQLN